ncbi:MAG: DNA replication/repair protein RecF [Halanaerobiaceae bacterium]|nr:DNA replication/repair protein RecF [Halanaerobiaceae bacterium]
MFVSKINLVNYRNLNRVLLDLSPNLNILAGDNGQGKTNLLESLYLMATTSSHRTNIDKDLINWEKDKAWINVLVEKKNYNTKLSMILEGSKKKFMINNTPLERKYEFLGNLNVVLFSPEDLYLVKGGPSYRRDFINTELSQVSNYYSKLLSEYNHILQQRNNLLKNIRDYGNKNYDVLDILDEKLVSTGTKIIEKRLEVIEKLQILARLNQRRITNGSENLILNYECSIGRGLDNIEVIFRKELEDNRDEEIRKGYSLFGPHRDDIIFKVNGIDIRKYGSQGQQRTTALALKRAELQFMKSETGEYPDLILDDFFLELDEGRKNTLIEIIADSIQTIITTTDINILDNFKNSNYKIFEVKKGDITLRGGF